jgi:hypothetical protein
MLSSVASATESRRRPNKSRTSKCLVDQLPNHRLQVIRETRVGIDVLYYSFAHRQRLEEVNESARQEQPVASNQLEYFADCLSEPQLFKRDINVELKHSINLSSNQSAIYRMLWSSDLDKAIG